MAEKNHAFQIDRVRHWSRLRPGAQPELARHFVAGVPARTAAGVSRNTAFLFFHRLRGPIATRLAEESPFLDDEVEVRQAGEASVAEAIARIGIVVSPIRGDCGPNERAPPCRELSGCGPRRPMARTLPRRGTQFRRGILWAWYGAQDEGRLVKRAANQPRTNRRRKPSDVARSALQAERTLAASVDPPAACALQRQCPAGAQTLLSQFAIVRPCEIFA